MTAGILSYTEALGRILRLELPLGVERAPLLQAGGRSLAAGLRAPWPLPRFDNSSMDGFALRASEATTAMAIVGESAAGKSFHGTIPPGGAIRISTGAELPPGLDAVVPVEQSSVAADRVTFSGPVKSGQFIRWRGSDIQEGQELFGRGVRVTPEVMAFLASFNVTEVEVLRRPRVGFLTSGDEIKLLGSTLGEGEIIGSSIYYLQQELSHCGCEVRFFGIAPDEVSPYRRLFEEALDWSDIVVTTAGVSVGEHDVVGRVIEELRGEVLFWKVAVRPGKPMIVSKFGGKFHFGFPGNPVSTCCNMEIFLKPLLRKALAVSPAERPLERMTLTADCPRDRQRLFFVYGVYTVKDGGRVVHPLGNQNSGNLMNAALANCLIVVEPGSEPVRAGEVVNVMVLSPGL
jgi:molybdopterin molybdotransferase